jgi:hypothetical protein
MKDFPRIEMPDGRTIARWQKDGGWHITEQYEPTPHDRISFPNSYPANDQGPFFIWSDKFFNTQTEAQKYYDKT